MKRKMYEICSKLIKVNNKDTRRTLLTLFWCFFCFFLFFVFFAGEGGGGGGSVVDIRQGNVCWERIIIELYTWLTKSF